MATLLDVQDNTAPNIGITLKREGAVIDLTNVTSALLYIKLLETDAFVNTGHETCTIDDAAAGQISYRVVSGDFATPGRYIGEVKLTYTGGKIERIYEALVIAVRKKNST